jgi:hypothetical protein
MKHVQRGCLAAFVAAFALVVTSVASANEVTKWNDITLTTVLAQPPIASAAPAASVFVAMTQGAVYGAVNAIDRHGRPYLVNRRYPKASAEAATAAAAYTVLDHLFPAQHATLKAAYDASLAAVPDGSSKTEGLGVGALAAETMLEEGHDGRVPILCAFGSGLPGVWQPLADAGGNPLCDPTPWVGNAVPFLVESRTQFRSPGPYPLNSAAYTADFNEVKAVGSINSSVRTASQAHAAAFWQSNPAANYNAMARRFVDQLALDLSDSARLFALVDLSAADALITTWSDKYARNFWRPITAIRHADTDGNPATAADPTWTPLFDPSLSQTIGGAGPPLITPPYPDHPSGATTYASASMHAFASFFGSDDLAFFATSSRFPGEQRAFHHFSDLTNEVLEARIWAGIHFRNTDVQAADIGRNVERYIETHFFAAAH